MNDTYQAMLESSRTQFYLGNGWRSPIIAEIVGRLEDSETVSLEDYERIDCLIEDMQNAIRAAIAKLNGPGMPHRVREAIIILENVPELLTPAKEVR